MKYSLVSINENFQFVIGFAFHLMTARIEFFNDLYNQQKRGIQDHECCAYAKKLQKEYAIQVLKDRVYHLGWNQIMDYPEYHELLIRQRVVDKWKDFKESPKKMQ